MCGSRLSLSHPVLDCVVCQAKKQLCIWVPSAGVHARTSCTEVMEDQKERFLLVLVIPENNEKGLQWYKNDSLLMCVWCDLTYFCELRLFSSEQTTCKSVCPCACPCTSPLLAAAHRSPQHRSPLFSKWFVQSFVSHKLGEEGRKPVRIKRKVFIDITMSKDARDVCTALP